MPDNLNHMETVIRGSASIPKGVITVLRPTSSMGHSADYYTPFGMQPTDSGLFIVTLVGGIALNGPGDRKSSNCLMYTDNPISHKAFYHKVMGLVGSSLILVLDDQASTRVQVIRVEKDATSQGALRDIFMAGANWQCPKAWWSGLGNTSAHYPIFTVQRVVCTAVPRTPDQPAILGRMPRLETAIIHAWLMLWITHTQVIDGKTSQVKKVVKILIGGRYTKKTLSAVKQQIKTMVGNSPMMGGSLQVSPHCGLAVFLAMRDPSAAWKKLGFVGANMYMPFQQSPGLISELACGGVTVNSAEIRLTAMMR